MADIYGALIYNCDAFDLKPIKLNHHVCIIMKLKL
jgi:hypothetical protein